MRIVQNYITNCKILNKVYEGEKTTLLAICLTCSLLAMDSTITVLDKQNLNKKKSLAENYIVLSFTFLSEYLLENDILLTLQILIKEILQPFKKSKSNINCKISVTENNKNKLLKQYLRKFSFFYQFYYARHYPNKPTQLSYKKVNMLAIYSLFIFESL